VRQKRNHRQELPLNANVVFAPSVIAERW